MFSPSGSGWVWSNDVPNESVPLEDWLNLVDYFMNIHGEHRGDTWSIASETLFLIRMPPAKPSIVVLPFDNLSGDPSQEYFADAFTEDLITDLSRIRGAFVIARRTSFTYKDTPVDVKKVARELGVRYILEGSVRQSGDQVRINAQLIDAETRSHLWSERYDRVLTDVWLRRQFRSIRRTPRGIG